MPVLSPEQLRQLAIVHAAMLTALGDDTSAVNFPTNGIVNRDFAIPAGETWVALDFGHVVGINPPGRDSNLLLAVLNIEMEVVHHLESPFSEQEYLTSRGFQTPEWKPGIADEDRAVLLDRNWWREISPGLHSGTEAETTQFERVGNVIVYTVSIQLTLDLTQANMPPIPTA